MLARLLEQLTGADAAIRIHAAEELGDRLEYGDWSETDVTTAADALIDAASRERDAQVRETLLNALAILGSRHVGVKASWGRLVAILDKFDPSSLENALSAIGFSRDATLASALEGYRIHADPSIRAAATDALREMTGSAAGKQE